MDSNIFHLTNIFSRAKEIQKANVYKIKIEPARVCSSFNDFEHSVF